MLIGKRKVLKYFSYNNTKLLVFFFSFYTWKFKIYNISFILTPTGMQSADVRTHFEAIKEPPHKGSSFGNAPPTENVLIISSKYWKVFTKKIWINY